MAMPTAANSGLKALSRLRPLLDIFPLRDRISYCFAYGSGVFEQSLGKQTIASKNAATITDNNKQQQQQPMIDLVLAVDDAQQWHAANLDMNKSHYSGLRHLGAKWIGWIQEHFGAKIFYNTLVRLDDGRYIKYGVITTRDLVNDLLDWETLYISGRLHKPTLVLQQNTEDATLAEALKINHESALHAALLMLGRRFTEQELYLAIAGLSYAGDFRMTFGEDRNKVAKIVQPQVANFRDIYQPILEVSMANLVVATADGFEQNCERDATQWHLNLLPKVVQHHLCSNWLRANISSRGRRRGILTTYDMDDLMARLAFHRSTYQPHLKRALETIVFHSSWSQSVKGVLTAGLGKSIVYSREKIVKMFKSFKRTSSDENK